MLLQTKIYSPVEETRKKDKPRKNLNELIDEFFLFRVLK